ncbi:acyl-CoA thioesterase [candidate division KSB1 bacterium]
MFSYTTKVQLHDTDAAGTIFFAHVLKMAHDAYQAFLESAGFEIGERLRNSSYIIPVVHAETDLLKPVVVGDVLDITLTSKEIGTTSYTIAYDFTNRGDETVFTAGTVHVVIDRRTQKPVPVPEGLKKVLSEIKTEE